MKISSKKPIDPKKARRVSLNHPTYVVPLSGGKDSQLVLSNAVRDHGPENVIALHHYTGIDHSMTMAHMEYLRDLHGVRLEQTVHPKYRDMWDLLDKKNTIPGRIARFCTAELKIEAFNHWLKWRKDLKDLIVLMGMRAAESGPRAARYGDFSPDDEFSLRDLNPHKIRAAFAVVRVRLPIVNLSTGQVFDTLRKRGEKLNPLYGRGHSRVGCYPCILAGKRDYRLAARDPEGRETIIKLRDFKELLVESHAGKYAPEVIIPHDLDEILASIDNDPFGFYADEEDDVAAGCQFCETLEGT